MRDIASLAAQTASLLRYQARQFSLRGVDVPSHILVPPAVPHCKAPKTSIAATPADATAGLAQIRADLGECTRCSLCAGRTTLVFGVGNPQARLMFVGEAPGFNEDLQGQPFVGDAGALLNRMICAMGLTRSEVYIANVVKCRPPRNRDPQPDEIATCEPFLRRQIAVVAPEILVALGRVAVQSLLRDATPISRQRGTWRTYADIPLMPTFHPAYLLRNPAHKRQVWQDLQEVMTKLGLSPKLPGNRIVQPTPSIASKT